MYFRSSIVSIVQGDAPPLEYVMNNNGMKVFTNSKLELIQ